VAGEVAHIKGERAGSARYDAAQPDDERQGYDNLMLLCPKHHKRVDWQEPDEHSVQRLAEMRERHLSHLAEHAWCSDAAALEFALQAIDYWRGQTMPGLRIVRAEYGANDTFKDVTSLLSAGVTDNALQMQVDNTSMEGDPLENVVKRLRLTYTVDGDLHEVEVHEGNGFAIP
jgi:hypothetical protein